MYVFLFLLTISNRRVGMYSVLHYYSHKEEQKRFYKIINQLHHSDAKLNVDVDAQKTKKRQLEFTKLCLYQNWKCVLRSEETKI